MNEIGQINRHKKKEKTNITVNFRIFLSSSNYFFLFVKICPTGAKQIDKRYALPIARDMSLFEESI